MRGYSVMSKKKTDAEIKQKIEADMERDIAVIVPSSVKVDDVQQVIETAGGELLMDSNLFDIYEENLEAERKSLAFHLIFQSQERTLTDNEINGIINKIMKAIETEGWEVRK